VPELPAPTEEEFRRLCEFIYRRTGMIFTQDKRYYVDRRVLERMVDTGATSFASYFARLRSDMDGEVERFINAFTVNETYFYREEHQLKCLSSDLLPDVLRRKRPGEGLRIWSVPCSTGEEPYSIGLWLLENWPLVDSHDIEIVGSDIDTDVLAMARAGVYGKRAFMRLPSAVRDKYFAAAANETWKIFDVLRESVSFTSVNLVDRLDMQRHGRFDVIFCRNVLIYFDEASRRLAAENLYEGLHPGGYICLGHTESMSRISPLFEVCRYNDAIVYQRPQERADD
jgi:chemotaxis protein methyltransferase CheR